ncbi:hypothetical protein ABD87_22680 [Lysinibacillus sphaericus]|uniref:helix-turn-helix domain-containing protein n=1 Tax=Lysinibacillus sphaericus TaxID=1421 RepID=UPI0018CE8E2D|nr:helix-turn-helix domain-containing protein [Lysinibacillus sphaericus]MBG9732233.1 hypothetical protein [Lysinibacillus sphaericus]
MNNMQRPSESSEENKLLRTGEVARILKVHPNTVRSLVEKQELFPVRHNANKGGHYRFHEEDVMRLLAIQNNEQFAKTNHVEYESKLKLVNEAEMFNSEHDVRKFAKRYIDNAEERAIFDTLVNAMNPYTIFGSYTEQLDEKAYSRLLQGKDEIWVVESLRASTPKGKFNSRDGRSVVELLDSMVDIGYGKVNGYMKTFLIVTFLQSKKVFGFDGTMQQMYPLMQKGILVLREEEMNVLYEPLYRIGLTDYINVVLKLKTTSEKEKALRKLVGEESLEEGL